MDAYFDSAIIFKLYGQEATSRDAVRLVGAYAAPYGLTQWQELLNDPEQKIARPRQVYTGHEKRSLVKKNIAHAG